MNTKVTPSQEMLELLETLPQDATWDDIEYAMYVIQKIRKGQESARNGKCLNSDEVRKQFEVWRSR